MARAHHEAPKAEKPKDVSHQFDLSDTEAEAKPAAPKKRARSSPPVPVEAYRPRKRAAKKAAAEASAETAATSDVEDVMGELRQMAETAPHEPKAKSDVEEALGEVRQMSEESAWDKAIEDAKMKAKAEEDSLDDAEWEEKISAAKKQEQERETSARETDEKEDAWFKQGEDPEYVKKLAEKQHAEEGRKIEDVRRQIAETYDDKSRETILDTDEEVEAAAKQAEAMVASGRINSELFNAKDYRYLLVQQARIDKELESAGWWAARKLRSEMKEVRKELDGYESQISSAMSERAPSGALTAREKEDIRYKGPAAKPALPQGSGTTVHKPGFFSRLFGKK